MKDAWNAAPAELAVLIKVLSGDYPKEDMASVTNLDKGGYDYEVLGFCHYEAG